ncbi:Protein kinase of the Mitotic Exit Network [Exophiala xenobiotica]|nr:Protein kinase of the Mitotic Exit Network [Exophiala xenobiotica]KAK5190668.1 Protein kinase of the Mitotic Exit Network [Exophiala xenobiotica]KAK5218023.1 Protein kinase of the Mitotic Exit Network [Exophiala xenobiotica]KAK5288712.1 Protein kinase of the Mitotic Exit Network [Exophiala xenobiotica]KAK5317521.1 Protein kinase of the Mitotic Exit Network [Exophiala xenobiotica]
MPARAADPHDDVPTTRPVEGLGLKAKTSKPPGSPAKKEERTKAQDVAELKDYQLGDCLGKGAFGSVYRALNWGTGETVAVKQIKLTDLPKSELRVIMLEIDLLKNLDHPNIVKYHGSVKTPDTLNIILEYCENGSLHSISKNFGRFPENLVALYMSQVLQGLVYLHEQGVIHRDIKGANILTTKQGLVKLADFGVASRTTGLHESSVVGTPYWMAPEVIELTGATTASDIWSLGCTVIELLDGKPPYHTLQPMPALFRIVNDDHPPLPQGASPGVLDFLMQCFQKDPNLRVSAKKLLKHPWIVNARRTDSVKPKNATEYTQAVKYVQEWNEALKDSPPHSNSIRKNSNASTTSPVPASKDLLRPSKNQVKSPVPVFNREDNTTRFRSLEDDDNWDNDFATTISPSTFKLPHLRPHDNFGGMLSSDKLKAFATVDNGVGKENDAFFEDKDSTLKASSLTGSDGYKTVRPIMRKKPEMGHARHKSEVPKPRTKPTTTPRKASLPSARQTTNLSRSKRPLPKPTADEPPTRLFRENSVEDFSDLINGNELALDTKLGMMRLHNEAPSKILESPSVTDLMQSMRPPTAGGSLRRPSAPRNKISMRRTRSSIEIQRFAENEEDEDFSDVFAHTGSVFEKPDSEDGSELMLNSKISNLSWLPDAEDEDDPFAQLEEGLPEVDLESNIARDKHARLRTEVEALVGQLKVMQDDDALLQISEDLMNFFDLFSETKSVIVSAHGVLPILEILEDCMRLDVVLNLLKIVNALIFNDEDVQENLCFVGGIPKINKFASKKFPREIRLEAAAFVRQMYQTSTLILQMFVSAGGLTVLVDFLEDDYDDDRELVLIGVNGIWSVFELQGSTPRNDFCRILSRNSVLEPLSLVLNRVLMEPSESGDQKELAALCEGRIASIFFVFSQAENYVKELVAERTVLHRVLKNLKRMSPSHQVTMLKFIKNLSMLSTTLDALHNSNAIDVLAELLSNSMNKPHFREMSNQILNTIYNLCRLSKRRQEDAALVGIIPILIKIVKQEKTPVKEFALPILCDMAHSTRAARRELWQNKGLAFYVSLLSDPYWQVTALDAIFTWLQEETARVEDHLLDNQNFTSAIIAALTSSKSTSFENLLEPLQKLLRLSPPLAASMARSPELFETLGQKLAHNKPAIRLNLLRIIGSICDSAEGGCFLLDQYGLYDVIRELSFSDSAVLVRSMAGDLIRSYEENENVSIKNGQGASAAPTAGRRKHPGFQRRTSSTTPPHLLDRQMSMPTSPQLGRSERASMNMYEPPVAQTPRRQRNGVYVNGTNVMRPASRDGSSYVRESSPAFAMPSLTRANTASTVSEMSINKSRLPRQSTVGSGMATGQHRLSRQSTRESMVGSARASASTSSSAEKETTTVRSQPSNSSEGNTTVTLTPVAEARMRREARHAHTSSMSSASNGIRSGARQGIGQGQGQSQPRVEVTVNRRTTARRQATGDDRWG